MNYFLRSVVLLLAPTAFSTTCMFTVVVTCYSHSFKSYATSPSASNDNR